MQGSNNDDASNKANMAAAFFQQLSGQEREPDSIMLDHSYAKPWNAHPDASHAKPARMLFMKGIPRHHNDQISNREAQVDVEGFGLKIVPPCDNTKSKVLMNECERYANSIKSDDSPEDWEENINKSGWTPSQLKLFNKTLKVLHADRLARLADEGAPNEPVLRRIVVDKSSQRMRQVFSSVSWDMKLLNWLHLTLADNLNASYLMAYLDVLQTLKSKIPTMIDKMLSCGPHKGPASLESLSQLLKKTWDPLSSLFGQHKPKRLPGNPLFVMVPNGPTPVTNNHPQRMRFWQVHLTALGKVIPVTFHPANGGNDLNVTQCLEQLISAVRAKVVELKDSFPNRPIILLGWTIGALIACHVSLVESVNAVICLGFPLTGPNGSRGDLDDPLLDSRTPTLFVVGQNASTCSLDDIEDFRERMKAETGLVVVGGADDSLRICNTKRKLEGITQGIVDRCIVDEIGDFIGNVFTQSPNPSANSLAAQDSKYAAAGSQGPVVKRKYKRRTPKELADANSATTATKRKPRANLGRQSASSAAALNKSAPPASPLSNTTETSSTGSSASDNMTASRSTEGKKSICRKPRRVEAEQQQQAQQQLQQPPTRKRRTSKLTIDLSDPNELSALLSGSGPSDIFRSSAVDLEHGFYSKLSPKKSRGMSLNIGSLSSLSHYQQSQTISPPRRSPQKASARMQTNLDTVDSTIMNVSSSKEASVPTPILSQALSHVPSSAANPKHVTLVTCSAPGKKSSSDTTYFTLSTSPYNSAFSSTLLSSSSSMSSFSKSLPCNSPKITAALKGAEQGETFVEPSEEQVEAIQRLQYHDFPLTTASLTMSTTGGTPAFTQAKILTSSSLDLAKLQSLSSSSSGIKSLLSSSQKATPSFATSGMHSVVTSSGHILGPVRGRGASRGGMRRVSLTTLKSPKVHQPTLYMMQPGDSYSSLKTTNISAAVLEEVMSRDITDTRSTALDSHTAVTSLAASTTKALESMALKMQESSFISLPSEFASNPLLSLSSQDSGIQEDAEKAGPQDANIVAAESTSKNEDAQQDLGTGGQAMAETSVRDAVSGLLSLPNSTSTKPSTERFRLPFPSATATRTRKIRAPKMYTL